MPNLRNMSCINYLRGQVAMNGKVQNIDHWSMDRVQQNMDQVHGPPFMDRVHGPPIFTTPKITEVNNKDNKMNQIN